VYQSAAELLDLERGEVMMVAAHLNDLRAAKAQGLKTAFVPRPKEYGPAGKPDLAPNDAVDVTAKDFVQLASTLGA
jgi:2-haloacid dehalogenase